MLIGLAAASRQVRQPTRLRSGWQVGGGAEREREISKIGNLQLIVKTH